jgi:hypothetical protein
MVIIFKKELKIWVLKRLKYLTVLHGKVLLWNNGMRPHLSLNRNSPIPRKIETNKDVEIKSKPILGGLHHFFPSISIILLNAILLSI